SQSSARRWPGFPPRSPPWPSGAAARLPASTARCLPGPLPRPAPASHPSNDTHVQAADAAGKIVVMHVPQAGGPKHGRERLLVRKLHNGFGQVAVRVGIALDKTADQGHQVTEIEEVDFTEDGPHGTGELQHQYPPAGPHHPPHL